MDKVVREIRVDLTPAEVEARRQSLAENGLQLVAWEANRKVVLAPIDAEGKHLKETRKELAEAIETRKELRSVECVWVEEGTQRYLRRIDNGQTIDQEPLSPEEIRRNRQTSLPLEEPPAAPKKARTLALPAVAGPGLQEEAQAHEGGVIAPEAPYAAPALPGPRHPDAIEGELVSDAEIEAEEEARAAHNLRESWRTMALVIVENHGTTGISGPDLHEIVCAVCADQALAAPSSEELLDLLVTMIKSGALSRDAQGWYVCPPRAPSDASVQRAVVRVLQVEKGWCTQPVLVKLVQEEFPIGVCPPESQILDCLRALQRGGRAEWDGDDGAPCWKLIPEAPKAKPSKGKGKKASIAEASQAAYEAEGEALGKALDGDLETTPFRPSKRPARGRKAAH